MTKFGFTRITPRIEILWSFAILWLWPCRCILISLFFVPFVGHSAEISGFPCQHTEPVNMPIACFGRCFNQGLCHFEHARCPFSAAPFGKFPGKKALHCVVLAMAACPSQQSQRARMGSMENRWRAGQDGGTVDMEAFEAKINAHKQAKEKQPKAEPGPPEPFAKLKPVDRDAINEQRRLTELAAEMKRVSQRLDEHMAEVNAKEADPSPSEDAVKGLEKKPSLSPPPPPPTLLGKAQGEKKPILPPPCARAHGRGQGNGKRSLPKSMGPRRMSWSWRCWSSLIHTPLSSSMQMKSNGFRRRNHAWEGCRHVAGLNLTQSAFFGSHDGPDQRRSLWAFSFAYFAL